MTVTNETHTYDNSKGMIRVSDRAHRFLPLGGPETTLAEWNKTLAKFSKTRETKIQTRGETSSIEATPPLLDPATEQAGMSHAVKRRDRIGQGLTGYLSSSANQ